jgi:TRAP-type mannitol/chloroaromatic compound transport system permease small subunit
MGRLLRAAGAIDRFHRRLADAVAWLAVLMLAMGAANALLRYLGRASGLQLASNAWIELQWYLFSAIFLLGAAGALAQDVHVRVDALHARLAPRTRARIDLVGHLLLLAPFCAVAIWISLPSVLASWAVLEGSPDPGGLPRYPVKTLVPLAFALLLVQGIALALRRFAELRARGPEEEGG